MQPSRPSLTKVNRGLMDVYRDQPALTGCRLKLVLIRPPPPRPAHSLISEDAQCSAAMVAVGQLRQAGKHKCLKRKKRPRTLCTAISTSSTEEGLQKCKLRT